MTWFYAYTNSSVTVSWYFPAELYKVVERLIKRKKILDFPPYTRFGFNQIIDDRDAGVLGVKVDVVPELHLDLGGPMIRGRPIVGIPFDGVTVKVPAEHLEGVIERLKHAQLERYSRFHLRTCGFFLRTLILPAGMRRGLVKRLREHLDEARERHEAFMKEYDREFPTGRDLIEGLRAGTHAVGPEGIVPIHPNSYIIN